MIRYFLYAIVGFTVGIFSAESLADTTYAPSEVIIKLKTKDGLKQTQAFHKLSSMGLSIVRPLVSSLGSVGVYHVSDGQDVHEVIKDLKRLSYVEYASPNYRFSLRPNENVTRPEVAKPPLMSRPPEVVPHQPDPNSNLSYGLKSMNVPTAWNSAVGDFSVVVAVIDTGVDYNHEDLAFNMWRGSSPNGEVVGFDPYANDGLPYDDDQVYGHGTHAAGIIGAVFGNGKGTVGVNQRVSIMAIKGLTGNGFAWTEHLVAGMVYAVDHGAKIISASWANAKKDNPPIIDALKYAASKGVLVVVAAGNSAGDNDNEATAEYPAGYVMDHLMAVASVDENDQLARSSNYGSKTVALAAPGVNIYSTLPGNKYGFESGTSMACPAAAGAAALVWSKYPSLTNVQVKKALMDSVDHAPSLSGKTITGGRVNVARALEVAKTLVK